MSSQLVEKLSYLVEKTESISIITSIVAHWNLLLSDKVEAAQTYIRQIVVAYLKVDSHRD